MAYFSTLIGRPVCDARGEPVGKLVDLLAPAAVDYPSIDALVVELSSQGDARVEQLGGSRELALGHGEIAGAQQERRA